MSETVRKRFNIYGRVQGVGFRYTARHAAESLGLTGWVRNEYDGTVTLEVQGKEETIELLLVTLGRGSYIRIDAYDVTDCPVDKSERGFRVTY